MIPLAYSKSYSLPGGHSVTFRMEGQVVGVVWGPKGQPRGGPKLIKAYRLARNDFLRSLDVPMIVVEV